MKIGRLAMQVLRALYEIGGLLNHIGEIITGLVLLAFSYWIESLWLVPLGLLSVFIGSWRFRTAVIRWRREARQRKLDHDRASTTV